MMHRQKKILNCLYCIFRHYLTNGTILGEKVIEHKMCVLIFFTNMSETFLILRRTERDRSHVYIGPNVKYRLFLTDFNEIGA